MWCRCCSAVVLVVLVLLLAEASAWLARQSKSTDGQRRGTQVRTASRTPACRVMQVVVSARRSMSNGAGLKRAPRHGHLQ